MVSKRLRKKAEDETDKGSHSEGSIGSMPMKKKKNNNNNNNNNKEEEEEKEALGLPIQDHSTNSPYSFTNLTPTPYKQAIDSVVKIKHQVETAQAVTP